MPTILDGLRAQRTAITDEMSTIVDIAEKRDIPALTDDEQARFTALTDKLSAPGDDGTPSLLDRIAQQTDHVARLATAASVVRPAYVRAEPLTYNRYSPNSYFRDLGSITQQTDKTQGSLDRLQRHAQEMDRELPERARRRDDKAEREVRSAVGFDGPSPFEKRINPNRTDGQGGYFVPPLWLIDDYIPLLRAGRPFVSSLRQMDLPEGTDSINIPKLATGTATGSQTDGAPVVSQDFTDTAVSATVRTIAGQEDVAIQLLDQTPGHIMDQVLFADLAADYNQKCDLQALNGTGTGGLNGGQVLGVSNVGGVNRVQYADAAPTTPKLWTPFGQSLSRIASTRFDLTNVRIFMHPRRWFWIVSSLDTANRPLVLPSAFPAYNPMGMSMPDVAEGQVGVLAYGHPVIIDANITTVDNSDGVGGTTGVAPGAQDQIYIVKTDDTMWFEGEMRMRSLPEILSGTLQVRFQIYNYVAQLTRYGQGISTIAGTGLTAPVGY